jgi:predicted metal-dependent peptidase
VTRAATLLSAAREDMLLLCPFWGWLAFRLAFVEDNACETAWTDGVSIGYNAEFVLSISHAGRVFLLAHEVGHNALGHPWRRGGRDQPGWNVACDFAINGELERQVAADGKTRVFELLDDALLDETFTGHSAEWIFDRLDAGGNWRGHGGHGGNGAGAEPESASPPNPALPPPSSDVPSTSGETSDDKALPSPENEPSGNEGAGVGSGAGQRYPVAAGEVRDAPVATNAETPHASEQEWSLAVNEAALIASSRGEYAGTGAERIVKAARQPRIDWVSVLRRFVAEAARSDYTWTVPSTRYVPLGMYLPALKAEGMGALVIAIDTSGSVGASLLSQMEAEARAIINEAMPLRTTVIYADRRVRAVESFEQGEPLTLTARGGGGTDFRAVFEHVASMSEQPACLVYLTDLLGPFPASPPLYPVLWANLHNRTRRAPFGETVYVESGA